MLKNMEEKKKEAEASKMEKSEDGSRFLVEDFFRNFQSRVKKFVKNISVEPIMFLYFFGYTMQTVFVQALYYEKICKVGSFWFNNGSTFDDEICDHLDNGNNSEVQIYVQKTYAQMFFFLNYAQGIPPIIFVIFLGPWSDKAGRKLIILMPLFGYVFYDLCFIVNTVFFNDLKAEFLMLEVLQDCCGSGQLIFLGCYSYLSDVSKDGNRLTRMSWMDAMVFASISAGIATGAVIYKQVGYVGVHATGLIIHIVAIVYGFLILRESRGKSATVGKKAENKVIDENANAITDKEKEANENKSEKEQAEEEDIPGMFSLKHIKNTFQVLFKKREEGIRAVIILLLGLFVVQYIANGGHYAVGQQYARRKFTWESMDYFAEWWSVLSSTSTIFDIMALIIFAPILSKFFHASDMFIACVSFASLFLGNLVIILANVPSLLYLSQFLSMFNDLSTLGIRSTLSKLVGPDDVGKIFACIGVVQAAGRLVIPIYSMIYMATVEWYPAFVYCLMNGLIMLTLLGCIYCYLKVKKLKLYEEEKKEENVKK